MAIAEVGDDASAPRSRPARSASRAPPARRRRAGSARWASRRSRSRRSRRGRPPRSRGRRCPSRRRSRRLRNRRPSSGTTVATTPWSCVATARPLRPSPSTSAISASRMRLNLPPKSLVHSVATDSKPFAPLRHSLSAALVPPSVRIAGPSGAAYTIALWNTLLSGSSRVDTFHAPPCRTRISSFAAPGCGSTLPSGDTANCESASISPRGSESGVGVVVGTSSDDDVAAGLAAGAAAGAVVGGGGLLLRRHRMRAVPRRAGSVRRPCVGSSGSPRESPAL